MRSTVRSDKSGLFVAAPPCSGSAPSFTMTILSMRTRSSTPFGVSVPYLALANSWLKRLICRWMKFSQQVDLAPVSSRWWALK